LQLTLVSEVAPAPVTVIVPVPLCSAVTGVNRIVQVTRVARAARADIVSDTLDTFVAEAGAGRPTRIPRATPSVASTFAARMMTASRIVAFASSLSPRNAGGESAPLRM
jgi:hypothetical protein